MKRVFALTSKVHGDGAVKFCWQKKQGNFLATCGVNRTVNIFDRHGQLIAEIPLPGYCLGLQWDKDGEVLAAIQDKTGIIYMWEANTRKVTQLDSGVRELQRCTGAVHLLHPAHGRPAAAPRPAAVGPSSQSCKDLGPRSAAVHLA
eukprot:Colp12_sorted_trinity150504_noHs@21748